MIQRMSGVRYTFENWDEPSAWLSQEGIEDLLESLRERAVVAKKAIWIVDHRALGSGGFSQVWQAVKTDSGSSLRLVAGEG